MAIVPINPLVGVADKRAYRMVRFSSKNKNFEENKKKFTTSLATVDFIPYALANRFCDTDHAEVGCEVICF